MTHGRRLLLLTSAILFCLTHLPGLAQQPNLVENEAEKEALEVSLSAILKSINEAEAELQQKREALSQDNNAGQEEDLNAEIEALTSRLENLQQNFSEIATKVDLDQFKTQENPEALDWDQELKSLLNPLIHSLVKLTSRPREIEELREHIRIYKEQEAAAKRGLEHLEDLQSKLEPARSAPPDPAPETAQTPEASGESSSEVQPESDKPTTLRDALEAEHLVWERRLTSIETELTISQQRLDQVLSEKSSFGQSLHNLFNLFFRSRGRNLLLAIGGMLLFWLIVYRVFLIVQDLGFLSKYRKTFRFRLFNVVYVIGAIVGGVFLFLFILFLFGDWLLLTLGALTLLGIAWTSKQAIANYWAQMMLLLNVGPVREGERLIYNGLPWLVQRLNFFTILKNPLLESGSIRLPISDMPDLRSKPFSENDPWFPTRKDDWVLLSDQTHGKIVTQTPDFVRLIKLGNSFHAYPTLDFLGLAPQVLSNGFRCSIGFGLDYSDQSEVTHEIPKKMHKLVAAGLIEAGYDEEKITVNIELAEAGGSSLDLAVIADFAGEYARDYNKLKRLLSRLCVDACNQYDWNIPFPQLTVHMDESSKD